MILVDDGVATGSTMQAAIEVARRLQPRTLALAIPVAPPGTVRKLASQVDELVCLLAPPLFRSVGQWYDAFEQTSGAQVQALLAGAWQGQAPASRSTTPSTPQPNGGPNDENTDDRHES